jgi:hypothetical protein|tara:strand:+ start:11581 stop:12111 length:531 start_codon:yes stop_codon:yes gene_type:complete
MIVVICLVTSGLAIAKVEYEDNTIGANKAIHNKLIKSRFGNAQAPSVLATPYDAFYQIKGKVRNNAFKFDSVQSKKSFPDDRWQVVAKAIAEQIEIPALSTGSRIKPKATAYVMLYKGGIKDLNPNFVHRISNSLDEVPNTLAILLIKQRDATGATSESADKHKDGTSFYFFEVAI